MTDAIQFFAFIIAVAPGAFLAWVAVETLTEDAQVAPLHAKDVFTFLAITLVWVASVYIVAFRPFES